MLVYPAGIREAADRSRSHRGAYRRFVIEEDTLWTEHRISIP
ncbi:hypothetical protein [Nocardia carnea]|nr:hypothetical protein [Nocardia carnea]